MSCSIHAFGRRSVDDHPRHLVPIFETANEARDWLNAFLDHKPHVFEDDKTLLLEEDDIRLRSHDWVEIMKAPVSNKSLCSSKLRMIHRFKNGGWEPRQIELPDPSGDEPVPLKRLKAPEPERIAKAQRPPGYVTVNELCSASDVPAPLARALLRASGRVKPAYGWAFSPQELPAIKKICGLS